MTHNKNVLFIVIDQLRADCVTGALSDHVDMPNLKSLMAEGVTFSKHYSVVNPCGPSRASLLTGRYAMNHRSVRNGTPLSAGFTNIAKEARKSGYEPLLFGYSDTSNDPRVHHINDPQIAHYEQVLPGFRRMVEMGQDKGSYPWRASLKSHGYDVSDYGQLYTPAIDDPNRAPRPDDPAKYQAEHSDTAFLTDECLRSLSVFADSQWFAHLTYIRPHPPLIAPHPYNRMYDPAKLPEPARQPGLQAEAGAHPFLASLMQVTDINSTVGDYASDLDNLDMDDVQTLRSVYLGLTTEVDAHIGRVIEFIKKTGQWDNTLVVVTADHGEMLGDHHSWGKANIYDVAYHTPLIIRDPDNRKPHGQVIDAFTESVDVTPTILDWIGQRVPVEMDGQSLGPFLQGMHPKDWRDYSFSELDFGDPETPSVWQKELGLSLREANLAILREDQFKLVHFNGGLPPMLFDMVCDPHEMENLADDPAFGATLLRMTQKMLNHRMEFAEHSLSDMQLTDSGVVNFQSD